MFRKGEIYRRAELHKQYGGQAQGGISTPAQHPFIMLFTGPTGGQYGYRDNWTPEGLFLYTGEGQVGDMTWVRGNRAIRDHLQDGKDLHLFRYVGRGQVEYVGQFVCVGYHEQHGRDVHHNIRRVLIFELKPVDA